MSQSEKVLSALEAGEELTAKQIRARFSARNPHAVINNLRNDGYPIYLNKRVDSVGRVTHKYRLGTPSRSVLAAGYRALSKERMITGFLYSV